MRHVDDFVDDPLADPELSYPRFFFMLHRLPAHMKSSFRKHIEQYKLYCTYNGRRYRVTGASRMGDIWLHSNLNFTSGTQPHYERRVDISECSGWSDSE